MCLGRIGLCGKPDVVCVADTCMYTAQRRDATGCDAVCQPIAKKMLSRAFFFNPVQLIGLLRVLRPFNDIFREKAGIWASCDDSLSNSILGPLVNDAHPAA